MKSALLEFYIHLIILFALISDQQRLYCSDDKTQYLKNNSSTMHSKIKTRNTSILSREINESDLGKDLKNSTSLSKSTSKSNKCKNITSGILDNMTEIQIQNESDFGKYFSGSVMLSDSKFKSQCTKNMILEFSESNKKLNLENHISKDKVYEEDISAKCENYLSACITCTQKNISHSSLHEIHKSKIVKQSIGEDTSSSNLFLYKNKTSSIISNKSNINSKMEMSDHVCTQDRCKLASWGLPPIILQKYEAKGISQMFPWQVECLSNHKVMEGKKNILYSAPTSAGKTLVAEILLLKTVLECKKKAIFVLPFVSVVREKMYYFKDLLVECGIKVEGFMGDMAPCGGFLATDIAIATIEKANSIINRLMEEGTLSTLGAIVIDELHLLGDSNRGYLLELLLTKLKYMTLRQKEINIQLIGMSATLPNLTLLAEWLDAELYKTEFRPIPLQEQCKIGKSIYDSDLKLLRNLVSSSELSMDTDNILQLCVETISDGHSVLIFCPTKNWCEKLAHQVAVTFAKLGQKDTSLGNMLKQQLNSAAILETIEQMKRCPCGLDKALKTTISFGVAFHHAGLTMDERDVIEGAFRSGSLRVLIATSTLSSGVNLPARRVIIRSPMFGGKVLDTLIYKQMIGRAGRMGKDTAGESILICKSNERKAAECLLAATLCPIKSCLEDADPLTRTLLEAVASEVVYTQADLELYINCTLASVDKKDTVASLSTEAIKYLIENEFLLLQTTEQEQRWVATPLGKACLAASISPTEGLFLFEELQRARRCFVLDTELHVIYLVTPVNSSQIATIDWLIFLEMWKSMSESERRVGQLIGIEERFLMSAIRGVVKPGKLLRIHKRFYTALALHDLVREVPLNAVCNKYNCCRGVLQTLQQSASTFAGMVTQFCKQLGWDCMELLVGQFQTRLQFGVCRELLDLLRISMLNGLRARSLYKQGITTVADLAVANILDVERALYKALPFESEREQDGEHELEAITRNKMRTVFVTGKDGLTPHEAAILLVEEARSLIQSELGLPHMPWTHNSSTIINPASTSHSRPNISEDVTIKNGNVNKNSSYSHILQEKMSDLEKSEKCPSYINSSADILEKSFVLEGKNETMEQNSNFCAISDKNSPNKRKHSKSVNITLPPTSIKSSISEIISNIEYKHDSESSLVKTYKKRVFAENNLNDANSSAKSENNDTNKLKKKMKFSLSSSPSLFEESLNIDTQVYNILEENIFDSFHVSSNTSINVTEDKSFTTSNIKEVVSTDATIGTRININNIKEGNNISFTSVVQPQSKSNVSLWNESRDLTNKRKRLNEKSSNKSTKCNIKDAVHKLSFYNTQIQENNEMTTWNDDSWNESKCVIRKISELDKENIDLVNNGNKNLKGTNVLSVLKNDDMQIISSQTGSHNYIEFKPQSNLFGKDTNKMPHKYNLRKFTDNTFSTTNETNFNRDRKVSLDSNKSDLDDIVTSSPTDKFLGITTVQSKLKLVRGSVQVYKDELLKPKPIDKNKILTESDSNLNKIKPKLRQLLERNILLNANYSTDSIVSNSDEDTPIKKVRVIKGSKSSVSGVKTNLSNKKKVNADVQINVCSHEEKQNINEDIDWNTLNIIKVGNDKVTFNLFKREIMKNTSIALALHYETYVNECKHNIGSKIINSSNERKDKSKRIEQFVSEGKKICGAAISWEKNIAYYISFYEIQDQKVSVKQQINFFKELLSNTSLHIRCFSTKKLYKTLYQCFQVAATCRFLDPHTADWLLHGNVSEKDISEMVLEYFPQGSFITKYILPCHDSEIHFKNKLPPEFKASTKAILTWHIMDTLLNKLTDFCPTLIYTFKEIEMRSITLLACMELTGFGVNLKSLQELSHVINDELLSLEKRAYSLTGRKFNFLSSKEVSQALGLFGGKRNGINKIFLERCNTPISNLVISWRKLNTTKTKIVQPLLNLAQHNSRIHGNCVTCTLTGRISMHEPNLQNIPKDFNSEDNSFVLSVRMAFIPTEGYVLLSADYCQLELRILAHFSKDTILCSILRNEGDIFKYIAARWNNVSEKQIDDNMRQRAKQLCYGMIYGMGVKTLAENLKVTEIEAKIFLETFMSAYPGVCQWLKDVILEAHEKGYITTLMERRRMLPGLKSTNLYEKAQGERQAVNTKIQGSAADIAKQAMVNIEDRIRNEFPNSAIVMTNTNVKQKIRQVRKDNKQRGGYLVLQLHDELLYEVNTTDLREVASIVKESMEQVCHLAVPLPVKIKVGSAWGDLKEYNI